MILPNHILEKMSPEDRAKLGKAGMTIAEAIQKAINKSEGDLQKQISNWLDLHDIAFYRAAMHKKTTGRVGWPDFTFAINGRACAIEAKFDHGDTSDEQKKTIAAMRTNGWCVAVVRSLSEVIEFMKGVRE